MAKIKYYKAFDKDLKCRDMQYEIGKEYTFDGEPIPCKQGFHFCKSIADCYSFYEMSEDTRICEVEALGDVATDDEVKFCTNHIKVLKEVKKPREKSNKSPSCSGYCNSGDWNSGNRNSGDWNSGDWNSGNRNSGDWNSGNRNSGDRNSGNRNSGDWNKGNRTNGIFNCDTDPKIMIFDNPSDWTLKTWYESKAYGVMRNCPCTYSDFIYTSDMSDEEKENHPEHKTIGGYVKTFVVTDADKQAWWDKLSDFDKQEVYNLPNFDKAKFKLCTGIEIKENEQE